MNQMMDQVYLNHLGLVCAAGDQHQQVLRRVRSGRGDCLTMSNEYATDRSLPLGKVHAQLPSLVHFSQCYQSRCNQILAAAMQQILAPFEKMRQGVNPLRIGIVLGTSTSGIAEGECAFSERNISGQFPQSFSYRKQELSSPANFLSEWLGVQGPAYVISTACTSSAKALVSGRMLIQNGMCDVVIAGGVDSLCQLTIHGFQSLEAVSDTLCQPSSLSRKGINIGEGAALFLLSKESGPVSLIGAGESSDAYHFSAPNPDAIGATSAMKKALANASLQPDQIGYLNLHGTATVQNDAMESIAVEQVLGNDVPCSSTKPYTGHTLGAAGAVDASLCWLTLADAEPLLPVHMWDGKQDPNLRPIRLAQAGEAVTNLTCIMSNSFAFGGNNISLILRKTA